MAADNGVFSAAKAAKAFVLRMWVPKVLAAFATPGLHRLREATVVPERIRAWRGGAGGLSLSA